MDYVELISVSFFASFVPSTDNLNEINFNWPFSQIFLLKRTEIGQLYAIAGNSQKVGLCQYVKEYSKMTQVEKRGIAGAYKKGCGCEVSNFQIFY